MADLIVQVTHPDLGGTLKLTIAEGNGFEDNAAAVGWTPEVPPAQEDIDAAFRKVLDEKPGSTERLEAQAVLQKLESSQIANPVTPVAFLATFMRKQIEGLLIDQVSMNEQQQIAAAKVEEQAISAVAERMTVEAIPAD